MEEIILGGVGASAAATGLVLFLRMLMRRKKCGVCTGKTVNSERNGKGWYNAVMEYTADGKQYRESSSFEYSQPVETGTEKVLMYDKQSPERFWFADAVRVRMLGFGLLAAVGALMVLRFWIL